MGTFAGVLLACLAVTFLLPGCFDPVVPAASSTSASPTQDAQTARAEPPLPTATATTDTLRFLDRPSFTTAAPTGAEPLRVPIDSFYGQTVRGGGVNSFTDTWDHTLSQPLQALRGTATLLVETNAELANNPIPTAQGCFWALSVVAGPVQTGEYHDLGCLAEGITVPPGLHRLEFEFALTGIAWAAGTPLHFEFHTQEGTPRAPGTVVVLLTGSASADSRIQVEGLMAPVEAVVREATATLEGR